MVEIKNLKFINGKVWWLWSAFISTGFAIFSSLLINICYQTKDLKQYHYFSFGNNEQKKRILGFCFKKKTKNWRIFISWMRNRLRYESASTFYGSLAVSTDENVNFKSPQEKALKLEKLRCKILI